MKKVLVLDNYDSFTYNLVHYIEADGEFQTDVFRNDQITLPEIQQYDRIVLSPGPGLPSEAGILNEVIRKYAAEKKILGVCLGQQAIAEVFGGKLLNLSRVHHGVAAEIKVIDEADPLFSGMPSRFKVGRYHSWVINGKELPTTIRVTAIDDEGNVMAIRHSHYQVCGVQFHPESVLTDHGYKIIQNWLHS